MPAHLELREVHDTALAKKVTDLFQLFRLNVSQRLRHARVLAEQRRDGRNIRARQQRARNRQKIVRVQNAVFRDTTASLSPRFSHPCCHHIEQLLGGIKQVSFLNLLQHRVIRAVPRL